MTPSSTRTFVLLGVLAGLAACATTAGGGAGGSAEGRGGTSGGVGGGITLPGGGLPGAGVPSAGVPGAGLPDAGRPDAGAGSGAPAAAGGSSDSGAVTGDAKERGGDGGSGGAGSAATHAPATTADERRDVLQRRLDDSLGAFDATLRSEQERVAQERDSRAATGAGPASADGGATSDAIRSARAGDLRSESAPTAQQGAATQGSAASSGDTSAGGGSGAPNRGIPSGEDDDIVARRLRRAAEQETDPELKEKLWKEYEEYKRNGQRKSS